MLLDLAATDDDGTTAHVITDGLSEREQQLIPFLGFFAKSQRETKFPKHILMLLSLVSVFRSEQDRAIKGLSDENLLENSFKVQMLLGVCVFHLWALWKVFPLLTCFLAFHAFHAFQSRKGLDVDIVTANASKESDKLQILNSIAVPRAATQQLQMDADLSHQRHSEMKRGDATGATATTRSGAPKSNGTDSSYSRKAIETKLKKNFILFFFCVKCNASIGIR